MHFYKSGELNRTYSWTHAVGIKLLSILSHMSSLTNKKGLSELRPFLFIGDDVINSFMTLCVVSYDPMVMPLPTYTYFLTYQYDVIIDKKFSTESILFLSILLCTVTD